jgi:hypothetical protein
VRSLGLDKGLNAFGLILFGGLVEQTVFNYETIHHHHHHRRRRRRRRRLQGLGLLACFGSELIFLKLMSLFRHLVGLLGRVIGLTQCLYLHRTT